MLVLEFKQQVVVSVGELEHVCVGAFLVGSVCRVCMWLWPVPSALCFVKCYGWQQLAAPSGKQAMHGR